MIDNYRPTDRYLNQLLQESYQQESKHETWALPCGHGSVELTDKRDLYLQCNTCKRKFQLVWSAINKTVKEHK